MRAYYLPILGVWPILYHRWNGLLGWDVNGLINRYQDVGAINAAAIMQFLFSPAWLVTLAGFAATLVFGGDFLRHEVRRAFLGNVYSRSLFWAALGTACFGLREPYLLPSALVVAIAGFLCLLFDSARAL
jgi:hypothetical protein